MKVPHLSGKIPIQKHVSARPNRVMMGPGEWTLTNARFGDSTLQVAKSITSSIIAAPSWLTTVIDLESVTIDGQVYLVLAGSDGTYTRVALSPVPQSPARWVEITGSNQWTGASGVNRFPTASSRVSMAVAKTSVYYLSSVYRSKDVLVLQNGEDYPRIWDFSPSKSYSANITGASGTPISITSASHNLSTGDCVYIANVGGNTAANGLWTVTRTGTNTFTLDGSTTNATYTTGGTFSLPMMGVHKPLTIPVGGDSARVKTTFKKYLQIATAGAAKVYANSGSAFVAADSATAPYTGSNVVVKLSATTSTAAGDTAAFRTAAAFDLTCEKIHFILEGATASEAEALIRASKIRLSADNVAYASVTTWVTLYDPTDTTGALGSYSISWSDSTNKRVMITFDTSTLTQASLAGIQHVEFTWKGGPPSATATAYLLMVAGAQIGAFEGTTEWWLAYEDVTGFVENYGIVAVGAENVDSIAFCGGPTQMTGIQGSMDIPITTTNYYDFLVTFKNSDGASSITGGLNGEVGAIAFYARRPFELRAYYHGSISLYTHGFSTQTKVWAKNDSAEYITKDVLENTLSRTTRYLSRRAPLGNQIAMPIATTCLWASNRLFAGGVKNSNNIRSDYYFSADRHPFRFQSIKDLVNGAEDGTSGLFGQVAGESIQALKEAAASAQGANRVYLWTEKSVYALGRNDPYIGTGFDADFLGTASRIAAHGTNSPRSIAEYNGTWFYLDQEGQIVRFSQGVPVQISKNEVDDQTTVVPSGRRDDVGGLFANSRYYMPYTASGASTNLKCLVFLNDRQVFESDDVPAQNMERVCLAFDSSQNGHGQRIFFVTATGVLYAYEEGSSTVSFHAKTKAYTSADLGGDPWKKIVVKETAIQADDMNSTTLNIDRFYIPALSTGLGFRTTASVDSTTARISTKDSITQTMSDNSAIAASQGGEQCYIDFNGTLIGGSRIYRLENEIEVKSSESFTRPA